MGDKAARQFHAYAMAQYGLYATGQIDVATMNARVLALFRQQARNAFMAGRRAMGRYSSINADDEAALQVILGFDEGSLASMPDSPAAQGIIGQANTLYNDYTNVQMVQDYAKKLTRDERDARDIALTRDEHDVRDAIDAPDLSLDLATAAQQAALSLGIPGSQYSDKVVSALGYQDSWNKINDKLGLYGGQVENVAHAGEMSALTALPGETVPVWWQLGDGNDSVAGEASLSTPAGVLHVADAERWEFPLSTTRPTSKVVSHGEARVTRIETTLGYHIRVASDCPILAYDPAVEDVGFRRCRDLRPGDRVVLVRGYALDGGVAIDEAAAEFLGFLDGNGTVYQGEVYVVAAADDEPLRARLDLGGRALGLRLHWGPHTESQAVLKGRASNARVARKLRAGGLKSHRVGRYIRGLDRRGRAAYLRGLFEADASVSRGTVALSTASQNFAGDVQQLLLGLGILSRVTVVRGSTNYKADRELWSVAVLGGHSRREFDRLVGFIGLSKRRRSAEFLPVRPYSVHDRYPLSLKGRATFEQLLEWHRRRPDYRGKWAERRDKRDYYARIGDWTSKGYHFGLVAVVEPDGAADVYGLSKSPAGYWLPNGFVVGREVGRK
jgi:intein/homing endonuclease